jgi:hypothetical protein
MTPPKIKKKKSTYVLGIEFMFYVDNSKITGVNTRTSKKSSALCVSP